MKILTIGGATQDIFLHYHGADAMSITKKNFTQQYMLFESGEKVEIEELSYQTGGGATNSATTFKRLGFDVACFCNVGADPAGRHVIDDLVSQGIDTTFVSTSQTHQTGLSSIINTVKGERTIFAYRGANSFLELSKLPFEAIKQAGQLYITSLSNDSSKLLPTIAAFAKEHKIPIAINPGTSQLAHGTLTLKKSLQYIDILILNSSEARAFMTALIATDDAYKRAFECQTSHETSSLNLMSEKPYLLEQPLLCQNLYFSVPKFFKEALKMGPSIVVVTNGANGVYVATGSTIYFHPSLHANVVNTVGAGDAFGSCFVASLLLGYSIEDALTNGIVNSASVLENIGAKQGILTHEQLKKRLATLSRAEVQTFNL